MPRNEDGEFELILGNKQLLSVFFIVVVLLGVFFTMGYIVGRNSAPVGATETARHGGQDSKPIVLDSSSSPVPAASPPAEQARPAVEQAKLPSEAESTPTPTPTPPPPRVQPKPEPAREPEKPKATRPVEEPKSKPEPARPKPESREASRPTPLPTPTPTPRPSEPAPAPPPRKVEASPAPPRVSEPVSGSYLQVSAVPRPQAEALAEILQKRGFPALLARSSKEGLYRVIVGPLKDKAEMAKTRGDLEAAGMKNTAIIRY